MTSETTPLRAAFLAALAIAASAESARVAAEEAWMADDSAVDGDETAPTRIAYVAATDASNAADERALVARRAFQDSDEPREYTFRDEDGETETGVFATYTDAKDGARAWVRRGQWDTTNGTTWVSVRIACETDPGYDGHGSEDEDRLTVNVDPVEPGCSERAHDWQSPVEIVGGIEENPGVVGHGGGVIISECCMHCGCKRTTDTWAQRRDTGEQGLTSVKYEEGGYAEELAAYREERAA
jgi:hypothetical protein